MSGKPPTRPVSLVSAFAELKGKEDLRSLMKKSKDQRVQQTPGFGKPSPTTAASSRPVPAAAAPAALGIIKPASQPPAVPTEDTLKRKAVGLVG